MECNKEEAVRARELAETKMEKNDFVGARKLAIKAQQLCPNTDNIIQLLTVCDVHCASQQKIGGYEMDWYGILQIAQTADDSLIKKCYRKLALLLHPDKNKFPGAEAAFKLIGEAQRLLSDPVKRQVHDMERRTTVRPPAVRVPRQQTNNQYAGGHSAQNGVKHPYQFANVNLRQPPQPPTQPAFTSSTIVTACPFCSTKHLVCVLDRYKPVRCYSCKNSFIASEEEASEKLAREKNDRKAAFAQKDVPSQGPSNTSKKFGGNVHSKKLHMDGSNEAARCKADTKNGINTESKKVNKKRKKTKLEDASENIDSDSSSSTDDDYENFAVDGKLGKDFTFRTGRRSTRQRQNISYNESLSDDEDLLGDNDNGSGVGSVPDCEKQGVKPESVENEPDHKGFESPSSISPNNCKKTQKLKKNESLDEVDGNRSTNSAPRDNTSGIGTRDSHSGNRSEDLISPTSSNRQIEVPDPEFFAFDSNRSEDKFEVGQIWAVYSDDEWPKFYVQIKSIRQSPEFELVTTWLIRCPAQGNVIVWHDKHMPFGCGIFKLSTGKSKVIPPDTFSHILDPQKTGKRGEFAIFPQKGEVWALYKDWKPDMEFSDYKDFEYDIAEVVNMNDLTVEVLPLQRVSGHLTVFSGQADGITLKISKTELLRFSHQIPSFRLTNELNGTLRGCWELDALAIPPALLSSS
ncbi:unnamed protein product [Rhodiola kirilowii]